MNINDYVVRFGKKTFKSFPLNDVDFLIFSQLAYINLDLVCSSYKEDTSPIKIKDFDIKDMEAFTTGSVDQKFDKKLIELMMKSKRYKDIEVGYYKKIFSKEETTQFFAVTLFLPNKEIFISFRGTDTTIIGWKEDFLIAFEPIMPSQREGLFYAQNIISKFSDYRYYLGGHSKGGNIAFYVATHLNEAQSERLIGAYSFDGPGFKGGIKKYPFYEINKDKLFKYMTYNDLIGYFYEDVKPYKIVHSTGLLLGGHDPFFWQIGLNGSFSVAKRTSRRAKRRARKFYNWLDSLKDEDSKLIFDTTFELFGKNDTIFDLAKNFPLDILKNKAFIEQLTKDKRKRLLNSFKKLIMFMVTPESLIKKEKKKQE